MHKKELKILNNVEELNRLESFLADLKDEWTIHDKVIMQLNLVLEEVLTNIIFYAWDDDEQHEIELSFSANEKVMTCKIVDDGKAFDPSDAEEFHDTDKPAEERKIGGLGILFVKELTDGIAYVRKENKNILTIKKDIIKQ